MFPENFHRAAYRLLKASVKSHAHAGQKWPRPAWRRYPTAAPKFPLPVISALIWVHSRLLAAPPWARADSRPPRPPGPPADCAARRSLRPPWPPGPYALWFWRNPSRKHALGLRIPYGDRSPAIYGRNTTPSDPGATASASRSSFHKAFRCRFAPLSIGHLSPVPGQASASRRRPYRAALQSQVPGTTWCPKISLGSEWKLSIQMLIPPAWPPCSWVSPSRPPGSQGAAGGVQSSRGHRGTLRQAGFHGCFRRHCSHDFVAVKQLGQLFGVDSHSIAHRKVPPPLWIS